MKKFIYLNLFFIFYSAHGSNYPFFTERETELFTPGEIGIYRLKLREAIADNDTPRALRLIRLAQVSGDSFPLIHLAIERNNSTIVQALIAAGVQLNKKNRQGYTPLNLANKKGNQAIINMLIQADAS